MLKVVVTEVDVRRYDGGPRLECEDRRTRRVETSEAAVQRQTIEKLTSQLQKKDSIIAFVSEEHLALKKKLGES